MRDCYYQKHALPCEKLPLNRSYYPYWESGPWIVAAKISSIIPGVFVTHIPAFANNCCNSWNEFYFPDRSVQFKQFTAIVFQWKIHACNESQRSYQLFCHISLIQICTTTWDKAGDMPSMVTAIIAAGRSWTIDYNAGQACNVVIKVFTCTKTAWNRVRSMFSTVLTAITTIWRPGLMNLTQCMLCVQIYCVYRIIICCILNCEQDWVGLCFGELCVCWVLLRVWLPQTINLYRLLKISA